MVIKTSEELEILKEAGKILASILYEVIERAKPGVTTLELDEYAEKFILKAGGEPSFKNYKSGASETSFPASLCVSINDEVVHGIPSRSRVLREGDLASFDLGMKWPVKKVSLFNFQFSNKLKTSKLKNESLFVDMARTIVVDGMDRASERARKLLEVGEKALEIALLEAREGNYTGDIGVAVQNYVESNGFNVVRKLVGHGVGYAVHEEPEIPNFGEKKTGIKLKKGMVLALEPMITERSFDVFLAQNGWTWKTKDGSRAVHFEDTVVVGEERGEIVTSL